ncbi:hypothetical protein P3T76_014538 [Phytophthora citrophthora]|uniref:WLGC domain-containing protein n=1 Tax=Phytophthora citrophthora TaxID=4793 RepID=A0AAD9G1H3_9STRA|nr:hypothetical protein P3T76_014538 [Phytophthora citrophthora]
MKWPSPRIAPVANAPKGFQISLSAQHSTPQSPSKLKNGPRTTDLLPNSRAVLPLSFIQTFGLLGIPLVGMILVSIAWTAWLIVLTIAPNQTANYLMGTTEFDDGNFWLIIDPEPVFMLVSVLSLAALLAAYVDVVLKMTIRRNAKCSTTFIHRVIVSRLYRMSNTISPRLRLARKSFELWNEFNNIEGRRRRLFNAVHKTLDLAVQIAGLYRLLEDGVPTYLCYIFACLVAANSLCFAALILFPDRHSAFFEIFIDTTFDMVFAVAWPIWWLWYSYDDFDFDRPKALLNLSMYPSSWFERQARRVANSSEVAMFMFSFDALRMKSGLDLTLRMAMNFSFCHRLSRVVEFMILRKKRELGAKRSPRTDSKQLHIRRPIALVFIFTCFGVVVHTDQSILFSDTVCAAYPECTAYAYRWSKTEDCPCRALIDADEAPRTYAEWNNPVDATETLRKLARTGDLRVLEVVNRRLVTFPDELRRCIGLQSMYVSRYFLVYFEVSKLKLWLRNLMYTDIQAIPDWLAQFTMLEYLSIEGRPMDTNLVTVPDHLFDKMKSLTLLHFGIHQSLQNFPDLTGPTNLKILSAALLISLREIPSLVALHKLKSVLIVGDNSLVRIPNLSPNSHLSTFAVLDTPACCNGYIGACDPSHYLCVSNASCLDKSDPKNQPNAVTEGLLNTVAIATCQIPGTATDFLVPSSKEDIDTCHGVLYKKCYQGNTAGMCYSSRMQVVACQTVVLHEMVRRNEIQDGIGLPCDPTVEKWLGCEASAL